MKSQPKRVFEINFIEKTFICVPYTNNHRFALPEQPVYLFHLLSFRSGIRESLMLYVLFRLRDQLRRSLNVGALVVSGLAHLLWGTE